MALTREFRQTMVERAHRDPAFAKALLDEAATLFLNGGPEMARLALRDLVNATVGFESRARVTDKNGKSLHRMLSADGNPTMDNLAAIFDAHPSDSQDKVMGIRTIIPPLDAQHEFARRITAIESLKSHQRAALAELDTQFASLQHRAFRGEL